jgi:formylglycine-generating enzyme required for sulfatase activity
MDMAATGYRLPTEAEWEYACRAGETGAYSVAQANFNGKGAIPVGSVAANKWGLHDMHGNLWEWCWDWYGDYASGNQTNPQGPNSGTRRIQRGGGWSNAAEIIRAAYRGTALPTASNTNLGFRVVRQKVEV